ncbi:MAG: methyltransferase domain-containing protein [Planctomycetes bacterium]|nr:methyltransferase domain-containing protein [Planctomycetota bacterium]
MLGTLVKRYWSQPLSVGVDLDGPGAIAVHRRIIESNPCLQAHYRRWYRECLPAVQETRALPGLLVELGSGAGFLDQVIPGLIKTEPVPSPFAHRVVDAMALDFPDASLRSLFLIAVLHHVPRPAAFLAEAQRCLRPGGRLVLIDAHNSLPQRLLCRVLDHYEYFDATAPDWSNEDRGRMTRANLATAWMIFVRDRARFEREYPGLEIRSIRHHTFLSYILSGGMSYRPFIPPGAVRLCDLLESAARPLMPWLGTAMTIDIVRR